jgi:hypothetical protein
LPDPKLLKKVLNAKTAALHFDLILESICARRARQTGLSKRPGLIN